VDQGVDVLVLPLFSSVVQTLLLQLVEELPELVESSSSSLVLSPLEVEVEVEVVVEHWSLPASSATQVFVSVTQTSLLQLVDVDVEVVPGSLARAGPASPRPRKNRESALSRVRRSLLRRTGDLFMTWCSLHWPP
jgi:hypothetical protein